MEHTDDKEGICDSFLIKSMAVSLSDDGNGGRGEVWGGKKGEFNWGKLSLSLGCV